MHRIGRGAVRNLASGGTNVVKEDGIFADLNHGFARILRMDTDFGDWFIIGFR